MGTFNGAALNMIAFHGPAYVAAPGPQPDPYRAVDVTTAPDPYRAIDAGGLGS
jgi:hypothetical protein